MPCDAFSNSCVGAGSKGLSIHTYIWSCKPVLFILEFSVKHKVDTCAGRNNSTMEMMDLVTHVSGMTKPLNDVPVK